MRAQQVSLQQGSQKIFEAPEHMQNETAPLNDEIKRIKENDLEEHIKWQRSN
jgi:hypothetical protein